MKPTLILVISCLFTFKATAQQSIEKLLIGKANALEPSLSAKDAIKLLGKEVYVCDTVFDYKVVNDTLKMLFIGNKQSKQVLTIVLKGNNTRIDPKSWIGTKLCVTGVIVLYKRKAAIIVTHWGQLGVRLQI